MGTLTIRLARWPQDAAALARLDTSFVTETVYRPVLDRLAFQLIEEAVEPPRRKTYAFRPDDPAERQNWDSALIAETDSLLVGFAAAQYADWNRRVTVCHLYVAPTQQRCGVGARLLDALDDYAQTVGARCLWLETQTINAPAIRFYQRVGFRFCGFDAGLYDPATVPPDEIALFFTRPVAVKESRPSWERIPSGSISDDTKNQ